MDLQLGLALPIHDPAKGSEPNDQEGSCKKRVDSKRCHGEAFGERFSRKSQLLAWSGQPNEDDNPSARRSKLSCSINKYVMPSLSRFYVLIVVMGKAVAAFDIDTR